MLRCSNCSVAVAGGPPETRSQGQLPDLLSSILPQGFHERIILCIKFLSVGNTHSSFFSLHWEACRIFISQPVDQGSYLCPLQWKHRVLPTGPPEKTLGIFFKKLNIHLFYDPAINCMPGHLSQRNENPCPCKNPCGYVIVLMSFVCSNLKLKTYERVV